MGNSVKLTWHTEKRRLGDLIEWDKNPRQLKEHDAEHLKKSLDNFGVADPLIINTDNRIIGGHMRRRIMLQSGYKPDDLVDVRVPERELTEREAEELAIRLNKNTGDWDFDALANNFELDDLLDWGFDKKELDLDLWAGEPPDDVEPQIDKAEELREKWGVELGQLWKLGEHRIICGDCTDKAVVDRVMGEEKAIICWTDPPWNVNYGGSFNNTRTDNPLGWKKRTIMNDNLGDHFGEFAEEFCKTIHDTLVPGGILYMAMSAQEWGLIMQILEDIGFHWSSTIIWAKDKLVVSRKDYHTQYESIWYGWKDDAARVRKVEDRKQSDLWNIPRPKRSDEHPTMKPIELVERSIRNSSYVGDIVYEPFSGSGTTIIASERSGRICRAIELAPAYVAVAIQRWVDVTGGTPELVEPVIQR